MKCLFIHFYFFSCQYLACGRNIPISLPNKFLDLDYLYINIDLNGLADSKATLCLLRSSPNLQELEIWVSSVLLSTSYLSSCAFI